MSEREESKKFQITMLDEEEGAGLGGYLVLVAVAASRYCASSRLVVAYFPLRWRASELVCKKQTKECEINQ